MEGWPAVAAKCPDGKQKAGGMCGAIQHGAGAAVGPTMQLQWRAGVHGRGPATSPKDVSFSPTPWVLGEVGLIAVPRTSEACPLHGGARRWAHGDGMLRHHGRAPPA